MVMSGAALTTMARATSDFVHVRMRERSRI